jgi:hypothetical protein
MIGRPDSCNQGFSPKPQDLACIISHGARLKVTCADTCYPSVPVIAIFTKLDGRRTKVMAANLTLLSSSSDFVDPPPWVQQKVTEFVDELERKFKSLEHPPADVIKVESTYILSE